MQSFLTQNSYSFRHVLLYRYVNIIGLSHLLENLVGC